MWDQAGHQKTKGDVNVVCYVVLLESGFIYCHCFVCLRTTTKWTKWTMYLEVKIKWCVCERACFSSEIGLLMMWCPHRWWMSFIGSDIRRRCWISHAGPLKGRSRVFLGVIVSVTVFPFTWTWTRGVVRCGSSAQVKGLRHSSRLYLAHIIIMFKVLISTFMEVTLLLLRLHQCPDSHLLTKGHPYSISEMCLSQ